MTTTPSLDLARLNAVTDAASTSPWEVIDGHYASFRELKGPSFRVSVVMSATDISFIDSYQRENDLQFMATFNPQTARLLLDRLEQLENPWQPIETAPKDGTHILLSNGVNVAQGWYLFDEGGITEYRDLDGNYIGQDESDGYDDWFDISVGMGNITHWMPLPAAPKLEQTK